MKKIIILLAFTVFIPCWGIAGPPTTEDVVEVAYSYLGKKVKSGICSDFVVKVVAEVKGESFSKVEKDLYTRYLFVRDRKDVRPGDIVWLKNYKCGGESAANHVAIVSRVTPEGIYVLEQNVVGSDKPNKVQENFLCENGASGSIVFYSILGVQ